MPGEALPNVAAVAAGCLPRPRRVVLAPYLELCKARLSALVVLTAGVGFVLGAGAQITWPRLTWTLFGTMLTAWGANAFNQWLEVRRDARMERTRRRPLPTRRLSGPAALRFALLTGCAGPLVLAGFVGLPAASLALAALLIYVLVCTPLRVRAPLNTLAGAVVGALPPLVGWVAATGGLTPGAWVLGGILFIWQIPHALAFAWMYSEDCRHSGFRVLPVVDPAGQLTGFVILIHTLLLIPLTLRLTLVGVTGWVFALGALLLGSGLLFFSTVLARQRSRTAARRLFLASVIYLPLLLGLMVADRRPPPGQAERGPASQSVAENPH